MAIKNLFRDSFSILILIIFFIAFIPLLQQVGFSYSFLGIFFTGIIIILIIGIILKFIEEFNRRKH